MIQRYLHQKIMLPIVIALCWALPVRADMALDILQETGVSGGLIVQLGCGDGRLTVALGRSDKYVVQGLDADSENVDRARKHIQDLDVYGRVSVERLSGARLPYADNLVNLLVSEDPEVAGMDEILRVLAPNGIAYLKKDGVWTKTAKAWPDGIDQWTHFRHGADGNMVSDDTVVGPPRHAQWVTGSSWQRHHALTPSATTMVSAKGRLFLIQDLAPVGFAGLPDQWNLVARDAFNGLLLWKRPIDGWGSKVWSYWNAGHSNRGNQPFHVRKRLVAVEDTVFVTLGYNAPVTALSASTGEVLNTYEGTQYADEIVVDDGVLFLSVNDRIQKPLPGVAFSPTPSHEDDSLKTVWAIDPRSGETLWKQGPFTGVAKHNDRLRSMKTIGLVASGDGVFVMDTSHVIRMDRRTGEERWRIPLKGEKKTDRRGKSVEVPSSAVDPLILHKGMLLVVGKNALTALDAVSGSLLWQSPFDSINHLDAPEVFCIGDNVWVGNRKDEELLALDRATGNVARTWSLAKVFDTAHHHRCYPNKSTVNFMISGRRGAEFTNLNTGEVTLNHWSRGVCRFGLLPSNGMLYKLPDPCTCYLTAKILGFYALAPEGAMEESPSEGPTRNPLVKGPAYSAPLPQGKASSEDWPTFRGDPYRSGSNPTKAPRELEQAWTVPVGKRLSSPVIVGKRVFVSVVDEHCVCSLDAQSGDEIWSYTAGGPVSSPPTIYEGRALFGARDGWVHCLRASDGALIWRFRAAPQERRIMDHAQLESAWPVHGSVLVANGAVYFTAGRSSFLDGGVYLTALDVATGAVLEQSRIDELQTGDSRKAKSMPRDTPGAISDILATDGQAIYMGQRKLPFTALSALPARPHLTAQSGFLDDFWYHRSPWTLDNVKANLIVYDERSVFSIDAYHSSGRDNNQSLYVPAGGNREGMLINVLHRDHEKTLDPEAPPREGGKRELVEANVRYGGFRLAGGPISKAGSDQPSWVEDKFSICPASMALTQNALLVAGFKDQIDPDDPWATLEGRRGGVLRVISKADGRKMADYTLDTPPIWNGMAVAQERIYISGRDGSLTCFAEPRVQDERSSK